MSWINFLIRLLIVSKHHISTCFELYKTAWHASSPVVYICNFWGTLQKFAIPGLDDSTKESVESRFDGIGYSGCSATPPTNYSSLSGRKSHTFSVETDNLSLTESVPVPDGQGEMAPGTGEASKMVDVVLSPHDHFVWWDSFVAGITYAISAK